MPTEPPHPDRDAPAAEGTVAALAMDADIQALRDRLPTLEAVERRRGQLWLVAGLLLLGAATLVVVLLVVPDAATLAPDNPGLRLATIGVVVAFLLYVFDQERRMRRLAQALVAERMLSTALNERVRDLATLSRVGQVVNSVLTTDEVLQIILRGAHELTGAAAGSVMLVDQGTSELVVSVSTGAAPAPVGARQSLHSGVAGRVAAALEPILVTGEVTDPRLRSAAPRRRSGGSSVLAPMLVAGELIGVLALERQPEEADFTQWELRAVSLFANHAATAVINAKRYEAERDNVARLVSMLEHRSDFVATLVHDLKTPLTAIIGYAKLLSSRGERLTAADRKHAAIRIEDSSRDLLGMVDEVLRSSSFEAAEPVRAEPIRVRPFLDDLATTIRTMAAARDGQPREIRVDGPDAVLHGDTRALRSVLQNLLENAVKYSPAGSPVELEVTQVDHALRFEVRDHGAGIPPDEQEVVFERFRQEQSGAPTGGVGLGLYIVRAIVEAQGGNIELHSTPGEGSTFVVELPDTPPDTAEPPEPT